VQIRCTPEGGLLKDIRDLWDLVEFRKPTITYFEVVVLFGGTTLLSPLPQRQLSLLLLQLGPEACLFSNCVPVLMVEVGNADISVRVCKMMSNAKSTPKAEVESIMHMIKDS